MNDMRTIGKLAPTAFDLLHLGVDVIHREVHDGTGAKLLVLWLAQVQPHTSTIEEGHGLARDLEQEIEAEDVSVPGHRPVDIADADVKLPESSDHAAIIPELPPPRLRRYFPLSGGGETLRENELFYELVSSVNIFPSEGID
jgi:hypothetical protein